MPRLSAHPCWNACTDSSFASDERDRVKNGEIWLSESVPVTNVNYGLDIDEVIGLALATFARLDIVEFSEARVCWNEIDEIEDERAVGGGHDQYKQWNIFG